MPSRKKDALPYFPFYPDAWLSSPTIQSLKPREIGAYIMLLAWAWQSEDCGLPSDESQLLSLSNLDRIYHRKSALSALRSVLGSCFYLDGSRYYNRRLLEERKKAEAKRNQRIEAGKKGAASRWEDGERDGEAIGSAIAPPSFRQWQPENQNQIEEPEEERPPPTPSVPIHRQIEQEAEGGKGKMPKGAPKGWSQVLVEEWQEGKQTTDPPSWAERNQPSSKGGWEVARECIDRLGWEEFHRRWRIYLDHETWVKYASKSLYLFCLEIDRWMEIPKSGDNGQKAERLDPAKTAGTKYRVDAEI